MLVVYVSHFLKSLHNRQWQYNFTPYLIANKVKEQEIWEKKIDSCLHDKRKCEIMKRGYKKKLVGPTIFVSLYK